MATRPIPTVLSIAGSDSGGGAGIQADLKAFARCGVHGMTAITAITAQNTVGVTDVLVTPPEMILAQVAAVAGDIGIDAIKVGMLANEETVETVVEALGPLRGVPVVVDPVMVSETGAVLLDDDAREALVGRLLPLTTVATPNIPEARALTGAAEDRTQEELARAVQELGPACGRRHRRSQRPGRRRLLRRRRDRGDRRGAPSRRRLARLGLHPLLGARRPAGPWQPPLEAARGAREVASAAVAAGLRDIGAGPGPVDVFELSRRADRPAQ